MFTLYRTTKRSVLNAKVPVTRQFHNRPPSSLSALTMPLVDSVALQGKHLVDFKRTAFFGVQHILKTSIPLFQHLIHTLGANPKNIFLNGKGYSDCEEAESFLKNNLGIHYFKLASSYVVPGKYQSTLRNHLKKSWEIFIHHIKSLPIEKIVILDEGGHCFETMPEALCFKYPMVGIEQTRGGLYSPATDTLPFPLIEVASSALKRELESPLIIEALMNKLKALLKNNHWFNQDTVFGVLGNGAIGSHLTHYLLAQGYPVIAFDENPLSFNGLEWKQPNFYRGKDAREVLMRSRYIFGCTGKNVLKAREIFDGVATDKTLISCTSEDKEFHAVLMEIAKHKSVQLQKSITNEYITKAGGKITLINNGFPVNFDHSGESVPASQIQLTRGMILGALIQGARQAETIKGQGIINQPPRIMLEPTLQQFIAKQFKSLQEGNPNLARKWPTFEDLHSIEGQSKGIRKVDSDFINAFTSSKEKIAFEKKEQIHLGKKATL